MTIQKIFLLDCPIPRPAGYQLFSCRHSGLIGLVLASPPRNQWEPMTRRPSANTASQRDGNPLLSPLPHPVYSVICKPCTLDTNTTSLKLTAASFT